MQPQEIQKLKSLIQTSSILSSSEKTEWLALLDVMNDKQLGELEGILSGSSAFAEATADKRKSEVGKSEHGNQQATSAVASLPKVSGAGAQGMQMPKLSHIMNLPNFSQATGNRESDFANASAAAKAMADKSSDRQGIVKTAQVQQPPVQNKPSVFASKLKAIFQEKELPPGYAELELTQGEADKSQKSKVESGKGETEKNQGQKVQAVAPKPFFPVKESPLVSPQIAKPLPPKVPVPPKPKTVFPTAADLPVLKPLKILNPLPEPAPQKSPKPNLPDLPDSREINSLQDLAMFEPKILQETSLDSLAKKIKALIGKYGYFEVIFNIEKSGAYKNYISTGLKLLSDRSGFESLGGKENGDYLSKEQFEKFADLLAKIQTG